MGRLRPRPGVLICCWSLLGKGVEIETLEIASSGGGKNRYIWNPWVFWTGSFNKLGSSTQQKPRWHQFSIGPIRKWRKHSPQKWKKIPKRFGPIIGPQFVLLRIFDIFHVLDPRMDLEDSSSCGESHLVRSDFKEMTFLWGSLNGSQFFLGGNFNRKQHWMYAFYCFFVRDVLSWHIFRVHCLGWCHKMSPCFEGIHLRF